MSKVSYKMRGRVIIVAMYATLVCVSVFALFPIVWGLSTSLKTRSLVITFPPRWVPNPLTLENYKSVIMETRMPRYFGNSIVVAICTSLLSVAIASHAGYAAARFEFGGKNIILFAILSTAMIPGISILVPLYFISSRAGMYNTHTLLVIVYTAWQMPTLMWFLKGFFESIPPELEDAAMLDGCSRLRSFYQIILPVSQPGIAAALLLAFVYVWNDFLIAFSLTISEEKRLISVGLYQYISQYGIEWGPLLASVMMALIPVLILFTLLQKRFIQGLTMGATKG